MDHHRRCIQEAMVWTSVYNFISVFSLVGLDDMDKIKWHNISHQIHNDHHNIDIVLVIMNYDDINLFSQTFSTAKIQFATLQYIVSLY